MKLSNTLIAALTGCAFCHPGQSAVSAEEAKALGTTLTEFGAVKAGNADGSIPAYTGARITGIKPDANGNLVSPFKDEKLLYSVDGKNMAQYAALLTEGTKEMMKRYPAFRIDVYPTHRTMAYPDWVLKNTLKNATTAKTVGEVEGDSVVGAYGGVPFPIPKNGYEALWNHTLKFTSPGLAMRIRAALVDSSGRPTVLSDILMDQNNYYYDPKQTALQDNWYSKAHLSYIAPRSTVGTKLLQWGSVDQSKSTSRTWAYSPGQRRVRLAPESSYDTPSASTSGASFFEDQTMYLSRLDRFDFKLIGRREMLVPYNNFTIATTPIEQAATKDYLKPEFQRWEKHRVWVVEGTRKPGARHVVARRTFYIDEDTWAINAAETWDDAGAMYRISLCFMAPNYAEPANPPCPLVIYDLLKGNYVVSGWTGDSGYRKPLSAPSPDVPLNADQLAGTGVR